MIFCHYLQFKKFKCGPSFEQIRMQSDCNIPSDSEEVENVLSLHTVGRKDDGHRLIRKAHMCLQIREGKKYNSNHA